MTKSLLKKIVVACVFLGLGTGTAFAQYGLFIQRSSVVDAFSSHTWNFAVPAYQSVRVVVDGDGDTDLDCFVHDAVTGEFLGADTDGTDYCIVPTYSRSGQIRLTIDNLGRVYNRYEVRISR